MFSSVCFELRKFRKICVSYMFWALITIQRKWTLTSQNSQYYKTVSSVEKSSSPTLIFLMINYRQSFNYFSFGILREKCTLEILSCTCCNGHCYARYWIHLTTKPINENNNNLIIVVRIHSCSDIDWELSITIVYC